MSCPLIAVWLAFGPTNEVPSATWTMSASEVGWQLVLVLGLVILNGFFVAAEFALVKVRASQLQEAEEEGRSAASQTLKMVHALDPYLSACQLGVTIASIALGMAGEPLVEASRERLATPERGHRRDQQRQHHFRAALHR